MKESPRWKHCRCYSHTGSFTPSVPLCAVRPGCHLLLPSDLLGCVQGSMVSQWDLSAPGGIIR